MKSKKKFFKKRRSDKSFDKLKVQLHTSRNLTEEQKNIIKTIIKEGLIAKLDAKSILDNIESETGIYSAFIFFDKDGDDMDVYF